MLVYLHIPFCHRICPYCSFYKHTPGKTAIPELIDALLKEAAKRLKKPPRTLYLGGGTPSMLSPSHLRRLFDGLAEIIDFSQLDELTMEANPATFDLRKAELFPELGVTRVSLGIQSFHTPTLALLGREHSPEQAIESVKLLQQANVPSINIDLMFSIPGLGHQAWHETLATAVALRPEHISAYNLTYEEDTAFFEGLAEGRLDASEDRDSAQFHAADRMLTAEGYQHYETSNYARPGHHSEHNSGYWQGEDYLGLGPSAVSTIARNRTRNVLDTEKYVQMIHGIGTATIESEILSSDDLRLERLALLLRTDRGVPLTLVREIDFRPLVEEQLAITTGTHLVLTREGAALVDPIAAQLA